MYCLFVICDGQMTFWVVTYCCLRLDNVWCYKVTLGYTVDYYILSILLFIYSIILEACISCAA